MGGLECRVEGTRSFLVNCRAQLKFGALEAQDTALPLGLGKEVEGTKVTFGVRQSALILIFLTHLLCHP